MCCQWICFSFLFTLLVGVTVGTVRSAVGLKTFALTAENKRYKSIVKKKRTQHNNIVLLALTYLNTIKVSVSKALIDLC